MAGLIATGIGYETGAIQGFIRESAEQNEIDLANKRLQATKNVQTKKMQAEGLMTGAGLGYKVGGSDMAKNIFASGADSTGGEAATATAGESALGTDTLAEGGLAAGNVSAETAPTAMGATTATEASTVAAAEGGTAATAAGAEATAGGLAAVAGETVAVDAAATVAESAAAGSTIGPWGTVIGAVVGLAAAYLFGR